jgi:two-component system response regulator
MEYSKYTILLIEDDADDAEMTIYTLRKLNAVSLHHIDDGVDAVRYLFHEQNPEPELILLDLKMPKIDGVEILRKLKSDPSKKHIPVVALISSKEGKRYLESFGLKADSYLVKPVDCKNFLTTLTEIGFSKIEFQPSYGSNSTSSK